MILFFVVVILVAGVAALYWGKSIEEAMVPVVIEESVPEPVEEELPSGSYLVFESVQVTDQGTQDWANDDTETYTFYRMALEEGRYQANLTTDDLVEFAAIEHPSTISGSLTTYIFGQHLLMHRYLADDQDGILSLDGELVETRPQEWGTIRSKNGRYQVDFKMNRGDARVAVTQLMVTDLDTGSTLLEKMVNPAELDGGWDLEPFVIDDQGEYLYVHEVCGCEATLPGIWQVEIATGEVTRIDTLVDLDSWFLSSLDAQGRGMLAITTGSKPRTEGLGENLLPPTTIRILDLDSLEVDEILVDEERVWNQPWLDPQGNDRYVVRLWDERDKVYLVNFEDPEISEENYLTDAVVLDWTGDWLVMQVQGIDTILIKLINLETREEILIDLPERSRYVGSIELN